MRAFPADRSGNGQMERSVTDERLLAAQAERDRYRDIAEERLETIRDLRTRLDGEAEERRRLTMLLADQRPAATPPAAELPRLAWRRFLAWRR